MSGPDPTRYLWWLSSRAAGIVAFALITLSVIVGLAMASRLLRGRVRPASVRQLHESLAVAALVAAAVHGIALLGDGWLHPGVLGVTVPFALRYRPLYTGVGIIAGYVAGLLGLSFYARRQIGARLWRRLHRLTIAVYLLGLVHALGAGTDAATPWFRAAALATLAPVAALFVARLRPARKRAAARLPIREAAG